MHLASDTRSLDRVQKVMGDVKQQIMVSCEGGLLEGAGIKRTQTIL